MAEPIEVGLECEPQDNSPDDERRVLVPGPRATGARLRTTIIQPARPARLTDGRSPEAANARKMGRQALYQGEKEIRSLLWFVAELAARVSNMEESVLSNADLIEAVVAELKAATANISAKIAALQTAVANGEDLSAPLADLQGAADAVNAIVPPAGPTDGSPPATPTS